MKANDQELHFKYVRMTPRIFDRLLQTVEPFMRWRHAYRSATRTPISNDQKLVMTLKYLASGQSMQDISMSFRVGHSTTRMIIIEVCQAMWMGLSGKYLKCPSTPAEWKSVKAEFYQRWNFPHCIGAIDGKHINIQAPHNSGSAFFNYKNFHSIVLTAVADAQYRFLVVDIGDSVRHSDGGILGNSDFGRALESATAGVPSPDESVPGLGTFPYHLVGDGAFPLPAYLMRPYPGKDLSQLQRIFNYRLSRSRRIIENAFGILVARWRIVRQPIIAQPDTVVTFVKACIALYNFFTN